MATQREDTARTADIERRKIQSTSATLPQSIIDRLKLEDCTAGDLARIRKANGKSVIKRARLLARLLAESVKEKQ
jgi:hypothetical protein